MSSYPGQDGLRDPLEVARGLGASKTGAHHWWLQRATAVALVSGEGASGGHCL